MECKFCNQPLNEGENPCPHCGKDNLEPAVAEAVQQEAPATEEIPAAQTPAAEAAPVEMKKGIAMTPARLTATVVAAVLVVAMLAGLVLNGMGAKLSFESDPTEGAVESVETVPVGTVPADGNPEDVTCKGSYTVSDEQAVAQRDTVVATVGDGELTNADLQIYYWLQVQQFLSEYGYYASYVGLDYTQPLDTQICGMSDAGITWQQFFLDSALATWQNYQSLAIESLALGYEIDAQVAADLEIMAQLLTEDAAERGFESADAYLAYNVGPGSTVEDYVEYLALYYQGYAYFQDLYELIDPTAEELEAYFDEHAEGYAEGGVTRESGSFVDVRHILIMPDGADSSTIRTETFSDEAWAIALERAEALLEQWKSGEATEDSFAELANANSQDGDGTTGGLYTQVSQGDMVEAFDAWIFDESRAFGDVDIVKTEFGYHIMFFVGSQPKWEYYAKSDYVAEKVTEQVTAVTEKYPMTVDFGKIVLGFVDMT